MRPFPACTADSRDYLVHSPLALATVLEVGYLPSTHARHYPHHPLPAPFTASTTAFLYGLDCSDFRDGGHEQLTSYGGRLKPAFAKVI
jgi:hypothetical protein